MEPSFERYLIEKGVDKNGVKVLITEVLSRHIFNSLKEEHFVRLLRSEAMTIGCHAILWELWESENASFSKYSLLCKLL